MAESKRSAPKVVAVVLTWNDIEMTARCVDSVLATQYANLEIVVVDNGTVPPSCPILKGRYPTIDTVQLPENFGFTGGCNRGMSRALELGADYVFLLNNDTIVEKNAIERLVDVMEARPEVGMASAVLLYPGDEKRIQFIQSTLFRNIAGQARAHENELLSDAHRRIFDVDFVPACAIMLRPQALREVGMFDETLFTNWEDYDICCRFADAGWKIITTGTAEVVHAHGQTTGRTSPFITYLFTRNRLICLFRYGDPKAILLRSPHILRHFYWQMKAYGLSNWASHKAFFTGVADFMLGVRGMGHVPSDRRDRPAKSRSAG